RGEQPKTDQKNKRQNMDVMEIRKKAHGLLTRSLADGTFDELSKSRIQDSSFLIHFIGAILMTTNDSTDGRQ
ncbi:MAG: hypothetical protein K8F91_12455, partial [Candidatus Obscuribacterales bacterium]|nr:hypothetical protein [Candidatus Obscuribacterales bacterium]